MLTVPEAAKRFGRTPETIRRWIRAGRLRSTKVGTQHVIDEKDLEALEALEGPTSVDVPEEWKYFDDGTPQPNWEQMIREDRDSH